MSTPTSTHPSVTLFTSTMSALGAQDWALAPQLVTDDFALTFKPTSLGMPVMGKADFQLEGGGRLASMFSAKFEKGGIKFDIQEVYEVKEDTAIIFATSKGVSKLGTPWKNEYVFVVVVDETKTKVRKMTEFLDSAFMKEFQGKEAQAAKA